jgi:hypothetical protein
MYPDKLFTHRVNHQIHRLKGQRSQEDVFCAGNHYGGEYDTAVFPPDFYPFDGGSSRIMPS